MRIPEDERPRVVQAMVPATGGTYPQREIYGMVQLESGWDPGAENRRTHAAGLIQIMPFHLRRWGLSPKQVTAMSWQDQVRLVNRFFHEANALGRWKQPGDTYLAVAAPAGLGKPDNHVVYPVGSPGWRQNPVWRPPGGGDTTAGSIRAVLIRWLGNHPNVPGLGPDLPNRVEPDQPAPAPQPEPKPKPKPQRSNRAFWGLLILLALSADRRKR